MKANELRVTGYVWNTDDKTVKGEMCGSSKALDAFQQWLEKEGAPKARPTSAVFSAPQAVMTSPFSDFKVKKVLLANGTQWASK